MTKIHEFDPVVYPIKLWVVISNNISEIEDNFNKYPSLEPYKPDFDLRNNVDAFVDTVSHKESNKIGILVVFRSIKFCTIGVISHEATHISDRIWKRIGEYKKGKEANAYLVEWIVECIEKVKLNKIKL